MTPPGAGTRSVTPVNVCYTYGIPNPADPGSARRSPDIETQPVMDRLAYGSPPQTKTRPGYDRVLDEWPDAPNSVPSYVRPSRKTEEFDSHRSPGAELMDTVAHLQLEVEALKLEQSTPPPLAKRTLPTLSKPVAFTSTKVQWRHWLGSIPPSDALNVTLLVSEVKRTSGGIHRALWITGSVGRLSPSVREDDSSGGGGPIDISNKHRPPDW